MQAVSAATGSPRLPGPSETSPLLRARYSTGYDDPIASVSPITRTGFWTRYTSSTTGSHELLEMPAIMNFISLLPPSRELRYESLERVLPSGLSANADASEVHPARKVSFLLASLLWLYIHPVPMASPGNESEQSNFDGTWDIWKRLEDELKGKRALLNIIKHVWSGFANGSDGRSMGSVEEALWTEIPLEEDGSRTIRVLAAPSTPIYLYPTHPPSHREYYLLLYSLSAFPSNQTPTLSILPFTFVALALILAYPGVPTPNTSTHSLLLFSLSLFLLQLHLPNPAYIPTPLYLFEPKRALPLATLVKGLLKQAVRPGLYFFGPVVVLVGVVLAQALGDNFPILTALGHLPGEGPTTGEIGHSSLGPSHPQTRITLLMLFLSALGALFTLVNCLVMLFPGSVSTKGVLESRDEYEAYAGDEDEREGHIRATGNVGQTGRRDWRWQLTHQVTTENRDGITVQRAVGHTTGGPWERYGLATSTSAKRSFADVVRRYQHLQVIPTYVLSRRGTGSTPDNTSRKPCGRIVVPPGFNVVAFFLGTVPATIIRCASRLHTSRNPNSAEVSHPDRISSLPQQEDASGPSDDDVETRRVNSYSSLAERWEGLVKRFNPNLQYYDCRSKMSSEVTENDGASNLADTHPFITVHEGDLFANAPERCVLVHACNTQGSWGSGIAAVFKAKFPDAFEIYHQVCTEKGPELLGTCLLIPSGDKDIACLFASRGYGRNKDPKRTILDSTRGAVADLQRQLEDSDKPIYGCRINAGLFRVPWEETVAVLQDLDFRMTVYEIAPTENKHRITLNINTLRERGIETGDCICISSSHADIASLVDGVIIGTAWPSVDLEATCVSVLPDLAQAVLSMNPGDEVTVTKLIGVTQSHEIAVTLQAPRSIPQIHQRQENTALVAPNSKEKDWLSLSIIETLVEMQYVWLGRRLRMPWEGSTVEIKVSKIQGTYPDSESSIESVLGTLSLGDNSANLPIVWRVGWNLRVDVVLPNVLTPQTGFSGEVLARDPLTSSYDSVGGLGPQIELIRDLIEIPLTRPSLFTHFNLKPPRGLLLHGPPGTGKTHLARAIAAATKVNVLVINGPELSSAYHGETEKRLREVFERAKESGPCIVILDEVDAICPRRDDGGEGGEVGKRVVATLLTILDGMNEGKSGDQVGGKGRVVVIGTTNRPNAIDPALRRPGRFDRELEIGIPSVSARLEILQVMLRKTPHTLSSSQLQTIAAQTHGFVGADLAGLVREAGTTAIKRVIALESTNNSSLAGNMMTFDDFLHALPSIRPSALRSLVLETPKVYWSDIGGVSHIREKLKEVIEWPLLHPETFARLGVAPTKGVLLYGPPGCSKTLTAKALATESGINFLAVKGPELLNKFVGESERAVREVFSKARAGAPCIIFFDEVDALGTMRSDDARTGAHEGVLTSMLNEMDGIQDLQGVIVVAATNRPDVLDSALMRPGRLDRILYIGPPDTAGREEILRIRTKKMAIEEGLDFAQLAQLTEGCSGAELASLCQEAALMAMRDDIRATFVSIKHFIAAAHRVRRGTTPEMIEKYQIWQANSGLAIA
ncbi:AAA+-type ATPase [Serendipita sp. 399]|nr:AAA+-type ATPase [Serendipita sp. 399]